MFCLAFGMVELSAHCAELLNSLADESWQILGDVVVTTGPVDPVVTGKPVSWDVHSKQGVHLFPKHHRAFIQNNKDCSDLSEVRCKLTLDAIEGDISFDFTVVWSVGSKNIREIHAQADMFHNQSNNRYFKCQPQGLGLGALLTCWKWVKTHGFILHFMQY